MKPFEQWSTSCVTPDGLQSQCKTGASRSNRELHFRKHYGLTVDDVEGMRTAQGGVCAVCTTGPAEHVDHDHRTGAVRGLLCFRCNAALGQLGDDPAVIRRAAVYLERVRAADHRPAV